MNTNQFPEVSVETLRSISEQIKAEGGRPIIDKWLKLMADENPELLKLLTLVAHVSAAIDNNPSAEFNTMYGGAIVYSALRSQFASDDVSI